MRLVESSRFAEQLEVFGMVDAGAPFVVTNIVEAPGEVAAVMQQTPASDAAAWVQEKLTEYVGISRSAQGRQSEANSLRQRAAELRREAGGRCAESDQLEAEALEKDDARKHHDARLERIRADITERLR